MFEHDEAPGDDYPPDSVFRVINVPASHVGFTLGPDGVKVSRAVRNGLTVVAVGMVESDRGLVVPVGSGLGYRLFATPVSGAVGTAAHVDIPDSAIPHNARTRTCVISAGSGAVIHPDHFDDRRCAGYGWESMPDTRRSERKLRTIGP